jgi:hypothetical protein
MRTTPYRLMESFLTGYEEELKMGVVAKLFVNAYPDSVNAYPSRKISRCKRRLEIRMVDLTSATASRSRMPHMLPQLSNP